MVLQRVVKPKNQRVKRALESREPKVFENDKTAMFIKGGNISELTAQALKELYNLKKPLAVMYRKKNISRPFEDPTSIEFFANKSDASLFMFGSHSKKRPHNLVLGRLFDYHMLDMVELGIENFTSMMQFPGAKCALGSKPCLIFSGEAFEQDHEYKRLKNLLIDFFRGPKIKKIRLTGIEHVLSFTAHAGKIYLRCYKISFKKSGHRVPRVELAEMGPSLDLVLRRTSLASDDLYKRARKQPKEAKIKKTKNVSHDPFGSKMGRIHMTKQDLGELQLRKVRALKKSAGSGADSAVSGSSGDESESDSPREKRARRTDENGDDNADEMSSESMEFEEEQLSDADS